MILQNVFKKILYLIIFVGLFAGLINFSFAAPTFEYSGSSIPSGDVNINFRATYGSEVTFYANENFIGKVDVIGPTITEEIDNTFTDVVVPVSGSLIFKNTHPTRIFKINITGYTYQVLSPGQSSTPIKFDTTGDIDYRDEESGASKRIIVVDELGSANFTSVRQRYLANGINDFRFAIRSIDGSFDDFEKTYSVSYDKYPNSIMINSYDNVTNVGEIYLNGSVSDPTYPLFYVVNILGDIGNYGILNKITVIDSSFSVRVDDLQEGVNSIRFITTGVENRDNFNGEEIITVEVDTVDPRLDIVGAYFKSSVDDTKKIIPSGNDYLTNSNSVVLNISTDASVLNYEFNGVNESEDISGGFAQLELNLESGKNNLSISVIDEGGNQVKLSKQIVNDDSTPDIEDGSLGPDRIFEQGETHFPIDKIEGKTTKGNTNVIVFTYPNSARDSDGHSLSCDKFEPLFYRNLGDLDNSGGGPLDTGLDDSQISLLSFISQQKEMTSDSDGSFEAWISLQESNFGTTEDSQSIQSVSSDNTVCIILEDVFGNQKTRSYGVTLDAGNTMWALDEVKTTPSNIYSGEIEQTGGERDGTGNTEFGIVARFRYMGPGEVKTLSSVRVEKDEGAYPDTEFAKVETSRVNYVLDASTGEMVVYVPIGVLPMNIPAVEYPSEFEFGFGLNVVYTIDERDVPVDTVNPVWFKAVVNIERPLDHTKWLTPETIESIQGFLNDTIKYTEKFTNAMKYASLGGVVYCTGSKFYHSWEMAQAKTKDTEAEKLKAMKIADRRLFMACDRIAGSPSPYKCDGDSSKDSVSMKDFQQGVEFEQNGTKTGAFTPKMYQTPGSGGYVTECNVAENKAADPGTPAADGIWVSGDGVTYKEGSSLGFSHTIESATKISKHCVAFNQSSQQVSMSGFKGSACYSPGYPRYDDTRCNFFGGDTKGDVGNNWENSGVAGKDSGASILSSIRCGAITDTYSHAQVMLRVQEGIYKCLEQAKYGVVKGSYCERLLGQAVCDVATNIILPKIQQKISTPSPKDSNGASRGVAGFLSQMKANKAKFDDRYQGSILSKAGLQTDQIINKACLGAITGDWSVLSENILSSIEQNEVEPVIGPPFPESRIQGYDPVTGELSIRYLFTYAVMSGGQAVSTEVELICDKSAPNSKYCPEQGLLFSKNNPGGTFKSKRLTVAEGGSKSDSIVITEKPANVWYNKLKITHTYKLKGKTQTREEEFNILHKDEFIPGECEFSAGVMGDGAGFVCEGLFGDSAMTSAFNIDERNTRLLPEQNLGASSPMPYYSGNSIFGEISYSASNNLETAQRVSLGYMGVCNEGTKEEYKLNSPNGQVVGKVSLSTTGSVSTSGREIVELYKDLPQMNVNDGTVAYTNVEVNKNYDIRVISLTTQPLSFAVDSLRMGDTIVPKTNNDGWFIPSTFTRWADSKVTNDFSIIQIDRNATAADLVIYFKDNVQDKIRVDTVWFNSSGGLISKTMDLASSKAVPGECSLYMRLIPSNQIQSLNEQNFKTYNPISGSTEQGDIISNVEFAGITEKKFTLNALPTDGSYQSYVSVVDPYENRIICIENKSQEFEVPLEVIYQRSDNKQSDKPLNITYAITSQGYVLDDDNSKDFVNINDYTPEKDKKITIKMPTTMAKAFETVGTRDELTFTYSVKEEVPKFGRAVGSTDTVINDVKQGSFKMYLTSAKKCLVDGTPAKDEPEKQNNN